MLLLNNVPRLDRGSAFASYFLSQYQESLNILCHHAGKGRSGQRPLKCFCDFVPPRNWDSCCVRLFIGFLKTTASLDEPLFIKSIPGSCDCEEIWAADGGYFVMSYVAELLNRVGRGG